MKVLVSGFMGTSGPWLTLCRSHSSSYSALWLRLGVGKICLVWPETGFTAVAMLSLFSVISGHGSLRARNRLSFAFQQLGRISRGRPLEAPESPTFNFIPPDGFSHLLILCPSLHLWVIFLHLCLWSRV